MKNVHEGTKKSGRKFLLGTEYDSWVIKFERRKHTALIKLKSPEQKKTDQKSNSRNCFSIFSSKILSQNKNSEKKFPSKKVFMMLTVPFISEFRLMWFANCIYLRS